MKEYALPSREKCLAMLKEYHVPRHIVNHTLGVAKLGVFLANKLREKGLTVDVDLVDRACLLHDICKTLDQHEDAAYELLRPDYPVLAEVVRKHRYTAILYEEEKPKTWEEKLVYYADKRVMYDKIVTLRTRLEEAHKRYAHTPDVQAAGGIDTESIDSLIFKLEREIFSKIDLKPDEVSEDLIDSFSD